MSGGVGPVLGLERCAEAEGHSRKRPSGLPTLLQGAEPQMPAKACALQGLHVMQVVSCSINVCLFWTDFFIWKVPFVPPWHTTVNSFALVWLILWNMQALSRPLLSHPWVALDHERRLFHHSAAHVACLPCLLCMGFSSEEQKINKTGSLPLRI